MLNTENGPLEVRCGTLHSAPCSRFKIPPQEHEAPRAFDRASYVCSSGSCRSFDTWHLRFCCIAESDHQNSATFAQQQTWSTCYLPA